MSAMDSLEKSQRSLKIIGGISALFMLRCDCTSHAGPVTNNRQPELLK
jgi:hypothetical protein